MKFIVERHEGVATVYGDGFQMPLEAFNRLRDAILEDAAAVCLERGDGWQKEKAKDYARLTHGDCHLLAMECKALAGRIRFLKAVP